MTRFLAVAPRLPVRDLQRTVAFYAEVLGFRARALWPAAEPVGNGTIFIDVTDALEIHRTVGTRCAVEWGPEVYWYGRRELAFRDPDQYLVIISERTDDPPSCAEPS